jgi:hypothetical protein
MRYVSLNFCLIFKIRLPITSKHHIHGRALSYEAQEIVVKLFIENSHSHESHSCNDRKPRSLPNHNAAHPSNRHYDSIYATSSTTPPASVIFLSASLLNHLARTKIGTSGSLPFPRTFEYPRGRRSRTGTVSFDFEVRYSVRFSTGTSDQSCTRKN